LVKQPAGLMALANLNAVSVASHYERRIPTWQ
jgi:hypothetical protein